MFRFSASEAVPWAPGQALPHPHMAYAGASSLPLLSAPHLHPRGQPDFNTVITCTRMSPWGAVSQKKALLWEQECCELSGSLQKLRSLFSCCKSKACLLYNFCKV